MIEIRIEDSQKLIHELLEYGKLIRERTMANIPELDSFCEV